MAPGRWIGCTTLLWGVLSAAMAWADTEAKFLLVRTLLGAAEAGFFPGMIYLTSQWFPQQNRAQHYGAVLYGRAAGPDAGIAFIRCAAGDAWIYGPSPAGSGCLSLKACSPSPRERSPSSGWTDSPQHARFLSAAEKQALISELAREEEKKIASRLSDALRNGRVWQLALIYLTIQVAVYGLIFFLPTQVAALLGTKVGFVASVVTAIPWVAALFGTWLIPRYSDRTGERRNIAALTLLAAAVGIAVSGLVAPVLAIIALCVAAVGVIAVQPVFWTMPTQLLSGTALAAGIGFVNLFGAIGGFLAPIVRVQAETLFASSAAGLLTLAGVAIVGVVIIFSLSLTRAVPQRGSVQH
ncbi:transporter, major facilitator family protein [Klebsiella pneumoniae]|uniref:Transporter, major facilitator family protein n=1 Tax=Klebsiella pneumoniae TaxID=573 RepID=A0A2X3GSS6_KLEPN|nr:transporter, major facilitator family protein [Klebsiella pneumoniae]